MNILKINWLFYSFIPFIFIIAKGRIIFLDLENINKAIGKKNKIRIRRFLYIRIYTFYKRLFGI